MIILIGMHVYSRCISGFIFSWTSHSFCSWWDHHLYVCVRVFDEKKNTYTINRWFISKFFDETGMWTRMSQTRRPTPSWMRAWAFTSTLTPLASAAAAVNPSSNLLVASTWLTWTDWVLPPLLVPVRLPKKELENSKAFLAPCESKYISNIDDDEDKTGSIKKWIVVVIIKRRWIYK